MQTTWFKITFRSESKYLRAIGETLHNGRKMHETLVQTSATSFKFEVCHSINDSPFKALVLLNVIICLKARLRQKKNYLTNIKSTTWPLHCNLLDFPILGKLWELLLLPITPLLAENFTFLLSWGLVERLWEFPVHLKTTNRENWKKNLANLLLTKKRQTTKKSGKIVVTWYCDKQWRTFEKIFQLWLKKLKLYYTPELHLHVRWTLIGILWVTGKNAKHFSQAYWLKDLPLFSFIDMLFSSYWKTTRNKYVSGQSSLFHLVLV